MTNTQTPKRDYNDESRTVTMTIGDFYALQTMSDLIKRGLENPSLTSEHLDVTLKMIAENNNIEAFEDGDSIKKKRN
ncbi:MAG: hypothetical protein GC137_02810 [Alphaproteobacteria bacterium]|nr:hypothetical protein [Alphaproteobacteria bacterium]